MEDDSIFHFPIVNLLSPLSNSDENEKTVIVSTLWDKPELKLQEIQEEDKLQVLCNDLQISSDKNEDSKLKKLSYQISENFKLHPSQNRRKTIKIDNVEVEVKKNKVLCSFILVKGANKGKQCGSIAAKMSMYCHAHNGSKTSARPKLKDDESIHEKFIKIEDNQRKFKNCMDSFEKKINFLLEKNKQLCLKKKKSDNPIKLKKLNKKMSYKFMFLKTKSIAHFKTENGKVVIVKIPKNFIKEKDGNCSTIQFNFTTKKFIWVKN